MDTPSIEQILKAQANAVTEKAVNIPFEDPNCFMLPKGTKIDTLTIKPLKTGTWFAINPLLLNIGKDDLDKISANKERAFDPEAPELFEKYFDLILKVISMGIHNKSGKYPKWLPEFLKANCTWEDLHVLLNAITYRLGNKSFYNSIMTLASVSPMGEAEMIALQNNQKSWTKPPLAHGPH